MEKRKFRKKLSFNKRVVANLNEDKVQAYASWESMESIAKCSPNYTVDCINNGGGTGGTGGTGNIGDPTGYLSLKVSVKVSMDVSKASPVACGVSVAGSIASVASVALTAGANTCPTLAANGCPDTTLQSKPLLACR